MLKMPDIFRNGMVLQRDKNIQIWGIAEPKEIVTIEFLNTTTQNIANEKGKWIMTLPAAKATEDEIMKIQAGEDHLEISDIAVGEVWIAGGQSNMEFQMRYEKHCKDEKPKCKNRRIRFWDTPEIAYDGQENDFDYSRMGKWRKATPEDLEYFSAAGYYFEKEIEKELNVSVGIIGCNWGGTASQSWMSLESVKRTGKEWIDAFERKTENLVWDTYWEEQKTQPMNDRGNPFADAFTEMMLPKTPSKEEIDEFFASADVDMSKMQIQPQMFPGSLYEHMVKMIAPYTVRGVLWYQGESDDELNCQYLYKDMLKALITDWRSLWKEELPFLMVQLPGWESWMMTPNQGFHIIRDCQKKVAEDDRNVFLCSISDSGEQWDIHPKDKMVVGDRLALLALGHIYGKNILCDPPIAMKASVDKQKCSIYFSNVSELHIRGNSVEALTVYGDGKEINYYIEVSGNELIVKWDKPSIEELRIEFAQGAFYKVNLYNESDIPAIPFIVEVKGEQANVS